MKRTELKIGLFWATYPVSFGKQATPKCNYFIHNQDFFPDKVCPVSQVLLFFSKYGQYCLKFVDKMQTWTDARRYCMGEQADLAVIKNQDENESVMKAVNWSNPVIRMGGLWNSVWIGLEYHQIEGEFHWVDDSKVSSPGGLFNAAFFWQGQQDKKIGCRTLNPNLT